MTLVLSRADKDFATSTSGVSYHPGHPPLVLTPREPFSIGNGGLNSSIVVQTVEVEGRGPAAALTTGSASDLCGNCWRWWRPRNRVASAAEPEKLLTDAWLNLQKEIVGLKTKDSPEPQTKLQILALHAIREAFQADVALMQQRDFYGVDFPQRFGQWPRLPGTLDSELLGAVLEQILWKGDFAVSRTVKGSALKDALAESKRIETAQKDPYGIPGESGRHLVHLGLSQDSVSKTWFVNGEPILDNALYSVAMTDFLSYGDTGYTQLQSPAVPPAQRFTKMDGLLRVSDQLQATLCELADSQARLVCAHSGSSIERIAPEEYFDVSSLRPFEAAPNASLGDQLAQKLREGRTRLPKLATTGDRLGQQRPYWRFFIDKSELSFAGYFNGTDGQNEIATDFPGVTEQSVNRRPNRTIGTALQFEGRYVLPRLHVFGRVEEAFTNERTLRKKPIDDPDGDGVDRFLTNFKANSLRIESGVRQPFTGVNRSRGWWGWLASFETTGQLRKPLNSFSLKNGAAEDAPTLTLEGRNPMTTRYLFKGGLRWEGRASWLEAGAFGGWVYRPDEYRVVNETASELLGAAACRPGLPSPNTETIESVAACLKRTFVLPEGTEDQDVRVMASRASAAERGFFANSNFRLDLPKNWRFRQIVFEQRLQFFFDGAEPNAADTRFSETLSVGPTLPILPSLSLKPTYSIFIFQNRLLRSLLFGQSVDAKLEYRFDWRQGAAGRQVFKHGRP